MMALAVRMLVLLCLPRLSLSLELTGYAASTWGGAPASDLNCLNAFGYLTTNGSARLFGSSAILAGQNLLFNASARRIITNPATVNVSGAYSGGWSAHPRYCAPTDQHCNCVMRVAPVVRTWSGIHKLAWSMPQPTATVFAAIIAGEGQWALDEAVAFATIVGASANAVFFDWECCNPMCTGRNVAALSAQQLAQWLQWIVALRRTLRTAVNPDYEIWMYSQTGLYVNDVSYELLAGVCDRVYNANFYKDDLDDFIKPQYVNRTDLKPLSLPQWEAFAGVQLADTAGDISKYGGFYLEFRGQCDEFSCNASVYDDVPLIKAAGGFQRWLDERIAAMCRAGVQFLAVFADISPAYYHAVEAANVADCGDEANCASHSTRACGLRNSSTCQQDLCCTWDNVDDACFESCEAVHDMRSCQLSPRCVWSIDKCGTDCDSVGQDGLCDANIRCAWDVLAKACRRKGAGTNVTIAADAQMKTDDDSTIPRVSPRHALSFGWWMGTPIGNPVHFGGHYFDATLDLIGRHVGLINTLMPFPGFTAQSDGRLAPSNVLTSEAVGSWLTPMRVKAPRSRITPMLALGSNSTAHAAFANASAYTDEAVGLLKRFGFAGYSIDYEPHECLTLDPTAASPCPEEPKLLARFIHHLAQGLHRVNATLSLCADDRPYAHDFLKSNHYSAYMDAGLDRVLQMGSYHAALTPPPTAEQVIDASLLVLEPNQLGVGITTLAKYGYTEQRLVQVLQHAHAKGVREVDIFMLAGSRSDDQWHNGTGPPSSWWPILELLESRA
jgi:hypothetical protein